MIMNNIFFSAIFVCGMMSYVSGAPLTTNCKIPSDLDTHYKKLTAVTAGDQFLRPAEYIPSFDGQVSHQGETTCPKILPTNGGTQDRSSCPWYHKIITNSTLFPSNRSEAVCRCQDCIGSDGMHNCEAVYHEMFFLKLTSVCIDGLFVYEPTRIRIQTGCVCTKKKTNKNPSDVVYDN